MVTLSAAHKEWSSRPADERFASTLDLHARAVADRNAARRSEVKTEKLKVEAIKGDVYLMAQDKPIALSNWSFGQLATIADAPAGYLNRLPAELAVQNLNHGLRNAENRQHVAFMHRTPSEKADAAVAKLRALTSPRYSRIWNEQVTSRLVELEDLGTWRPAPAAFDGSRGLYLGDRDMFAFFVDNDRRIFESLPGGGLSRGFFVKNSEVGAASFSVTTFFYNYICGNHYVWGASGVKEIKIRHIGNADERFMDGDLIAELKSYADGSAKEDEMKIKKMRSYVIGKDLDEVLDTVMGLGSKHGLSKKQVTAGYELATQRVDWYGAPNTLWGLAGGLTEIARDMPIAEDRVALEAQTGKLIDLMAA